MKSPIRLLAALLAAALLWTGAPPAWAAGETAPQVTGSVSATLRVDYDQRLSALEDRQVTAELFRGDVSLGRFPLWTEAAYPLAGGQAQVALRNRDGGELNGGDRPGYLDLELSGLPLGRYTLAFTGRGYTSFRADVELKDYARHLVLGTGDATFTLGDVDGDGRVDGKDQAAVSAVLGSTAASDLSRCDLNGDGAIDIIDLAYVSRQIRAQGGAELSETALLNPPVDLDALAAELERGGAAVTAGSLGDLFLDNGQGVTLVPGQPGGPIVLPIALERDVLASEIRIVSPAGQGAVQQGKAAVEYTDPATGRAGTQEIPFDNTLPDGIYAIGRTPDSSVITLSLGRRVAVKKVTISVTKTEGGGYAAVETIQFLKDIVPENPVAPNSVVRGLSARPGSEQVALKWNALPNVSGYQVDYWPTSDSSRRRTLRVDVTSAQITGLENLLEYTFVVTPTDDGWAGKPSAPVTATPLPAAAPAAPDMISVGTGDGMLPIAWKASKGATYYELYYTDQPDAPLSSYRQAGGRLTGTQTTLTGLTNGVLYSIYMIAGNDAGRSGPSRVAQGTPAAVRYERPEGIPTQGVLDSALIQSVRLADPGNYYAPAYTADAPFTPQNVIDGDYRTHWTASTNFARNEHVICTFTQPVDLSAAIWVPRLDGSFPSYLRAYSVRVWYQGEDLKGAGHLLVPDPERGGIDNGGTGRDVDTWPNLPNYASAAASKFGILPFGPATGVVQISLAVEQRDYYQVSLSELMFLEYDPAHSLPDNIAALFADELRTQLASGADQTAIDALRARLNSGERSYYLNPDALADELDLAEELLKSGGTRGVVLEGIDARDAGADRQKYSQGGSVLQPLGAAALANREITIYASGIPEGESVAIYASQYNAEAGQWLSEAGRVTNGRNLLTIPKIGSQNTPRGGSLYLSYSGSNPDGIKLHIRRASDIPVLELAGWYGLDEAGRRTAIGAYADELAAYVQAVGSANRETNCLNVTEISMPGVLLSLPATAVLDNSGSSREERIQRLYDNVLAWEDLMHICKITQGIDSTYEHSDMQSRQNIRYMQMFAGAFMYAAGSHIGIGYGSCGGMVCGRPIGQLESGATANGLFGWGIAHEIGHNMDQLGRAEITNNIYSLMVQTFDSQDNTLPSRLEGGKYPAIFTRTAQQYPGASNDVFVQLGMYWQLHLAYDGARGEVHGPLWFYNQFFKDWKAGTYAAKGQPYDDRVALTASGVTGTDLTEFFTRWGMQLSEETEKTLSGYAPEPRALWYLNDQSRRDRLAGDPGAVSAGALQVSAALEGDNAIQLTITPPALTQGTIQGYEIRRSGRPIGFTAESAYTDVIGSGNHRTYDYEVVAYDTLGNEAGRARSNEIRVAYDKTLDPADYTVTRAGASAVLTLKEPAAVSGLKLTGSGLPGSGAFTVAITTEDGRTVTACTGSFDAGNQALDDRDSYVAYFWKPGTGGADTRIWTYSAKSVTITGIPAGFPSAGIQLISYAGDDIAFLEGGTAGLLQSDYHYTDDKGQDQVIAAGTLVIAGTYRGDPLYNTVKIKGRFTVTDAQGNTAVEERYLDGYSLLFAEIPADGQVSDISDGIFLFVPNVQKEAELQAASSCTGANLLPSQMKAELSRTDLPDSAASQRVTAETLWTGAPGGADLPALVLEGDPS